jgi:hypothetical protein
VAANGLLWNHEAFEKVEPEEPADGVVIEGDDLQEPPGRGLLSVIRAPA